jgi:hypothetical protein
MTTLGRTEKCLPNRSEKGHLRALRAHQMRNRPLPALLKRPSAKTGPGTLQREAVRRMWESQLKFQNGNSGSHRSNPPGSSPAGRSTRLGKMEDTRMANQKRDVGSRIYVPNAVSRRQLFKAAGGLGLVLASGVPLSARADENDDHSPPCK